MKARLPLLLFALIIGLSSCSDNPPAPSAAADPVNNGPAAPSFQLMDLEGNEHSLSDYAGQKVYVKFWASWCSICLAGMEELNTLAGEKPDFAVLTIVSPGSNSEKSSESFAKWFERVENTSNIQVLLDEGGAVFDQYSVLAYPTSVFIGTDGVLVKALPGHYSNSQIHETFETIR